MRALHSVLNMPEYAMSAMVGFEQCPEHGRLLNLSHTIHSALSHTIHSALSHTIHKALMRDGRIQKPAKDLRYTSLEKYLELLTIFTKHSILNL